MVLKQIIQLLCLFLAIVQCKPDNDQYIELMNIRDDYCEDYCANECNKPVVGYYDWPKTCTKDGNTIETDRYKIKLADSLITLDCKRGRLKLEYIKKLNIEHNNFKVDDLKIYGEYDFYNETFRSIDFMKALNLNSLIQFRWCSGGHCGADEIAEYYVDVNYGPQTAYLITYSPDTEIYHNFLSMNMKNLTTLDIYDYRNDGEQKIINFYDNTYVHNSQLEVLKFKNLHLRNLKPKTLDYLTNIKKMTINHCILENDYIFNSLALKNNLELLEFKNSNKRLNISYFESYKKLQYIKAPDEFLDVSNTNIEAFVCDKSGRCKFNIGTNGKRCPKNCICDVVGSLIINCKSLQDIPQNLELPLPITGAISLQLDFNQLTKLPEISFEQFKNIWYLSLVGNALKTLTIDQLPPNVDILDISNNKLTFLDDNMTEFISNMTSINLSDNPWQCSCKYTKFLDFLKRKRPVEYKAAAKRCSGGIEYPDKCLSCKDDDSQMFIVNCTDSGLTEMPLLPESNSLYYLDMRNNNISTLSKNLRESLISRSNSSLYKLKLFMSGNPWTCDCNDTSFFQFIKTLESHIPDLGATKCSDSSLIVDKMQQCLSGTPETIVMMIIIYIKKHISG